VSIIEPVAETTAETLAELFSELAGQSYPPTVCHPVGAAAPGAIYPTNWFPTIVASDATNAARLAGLGFVAAPTSAWTTGQAISIGYGAGAFLFNWSGAAWAAGAHA
jgi:hypothetical protein